MRGREAPYATGASFCWDARVFANTVDDLITGAQSKRIYLGQTHAPALTRQFINHVLIDELLLTDTVE